MTLLKLMPEIAIKSEIRFKDVFMEAISNADKQTINGIAYFILIERNCDTEGDKFAYKFVSKLSDVIGYAKVYGKDCQIFQLIENGSVIEL